MTDTTIMADEDFDKLTPEKQHEYLLAKHSAFWHDAVDKLIEHLAKSNALPGAAALVASIDYPDGQRALAMETFEVERGRAPDVLARAAVGHELIETYGFTNEIGLGIAGRATVAPLAVYPAEQDVEIVKAAGGPGNAKH